MKDLTCAESFCIRADFLSEGRWKEEHPIYKISLVNFIFRAEVPRPTPYKR